MSPPSDPLPPEWTPRQLVEAAQHLAAGVERRTAAGMANLPLDALDRLEGTPAFDGLLAESHAFEARPRGERDAVLERLMRRAVERSLARDRVGAIAAAMRLLGWLPPRPGPAPGGRRDHRLPAAPVDAAAWGDDDDDEDHDDDGEAADPAGAAPPGAPWGMAPDGRGGWRGKDGRPVMPDRDVRVAPAPRGAVRLVDAAAFGGAEFLALLDRMGDDEVAHLNHLARPYGGPQWDPRTRTVWCWQGQDPKAIAAARRAIEAGTAAVATRRVTGTSLTDPAPAPAVTPVAAEKPADPATTAPAVGMAPATGPAPATGLAPATAPNAAGVAGKPANSPSPAPADDLRSRLGRLLAEGAPVPATPAEADLAEAVCALRWPKWPPYQGPLDVNLVRVALAGRPVDGPTLARLGGVTAAPPPARAGPPAAPAAARDRRPGTWPTPLPPHRHPAA